jgi:hypothetical protein
MYTVKSIPAYLRLFRWSVDSTSQNSQFADFIANMRLFRWSSNVTLFPQARGFCKS